MPERETTYEEQLAELTRMIEEGHDDAERNGCVPPEEVERSCREAIARGLRRREARQNPSRIISRR